MLACLLFSKQSVFNNYFILFIFIHRCDIIFIFLFLLTVQFSLDCCITIKIPYPFCPWNNMFPSFLLGSDQILHIFSTTENLNFQTRWILTEVYSSLHQSFPSSLFYILIILTTKDFVFSLKRTSFCLVDYFCFLNIPLCSMPNQ